MTKLLFILALLLGGLSILLYSCCGLIQPFEVDLCWLINASYVEFQRAFPNYYLLAYIAVLLSKGGGLVLLLLYLIMNRLKHVSKQNLLLAVFSTLTTLILSEMSLQIVGFTPGQYKYNYWAEPVDSLYGLQGLELDTNGILKLDTRVAKTVRKLPAEKLDSEQSNATFNGELIQLMRDHNFKPRGWNDERKYVQEYFRYPVNSDGFYSISFENADSAKQKVLLLGDSFTWGHVTKHKLSSFANRLLQCGFTVYNTGISGVGVQQYEAVLKTYYPKLKPDVVVLNFFIGNDISYFKRDVNLRVPVYFNTSAGNIMSMQNGIQFHTMEDAYQSLMSNMIIPETNTVNRIFASTVITTYLWEHLTNIGILNREYFVGKNYPEESVTNELMQPIVEYCDSVGVPLIISVIPDLRNGKLYGAESEKGLFSNINYVQTENLTPEMYDWSNGHFNDEGHKVYANYLENLIDSCFQSSANGK